MKQRIGGEFTGRCACHVECGVDRGVCCGIRDPGPGRQTENKKRRETKHANPLWHAVTVAPKPRNPPSTGFPTKSNFIRELS